MVTHAQIMPALLITDNSWIFFLLWPSAGITGGVVEAY